MARWSLPCGIAACLIATAAPAQQPPRTLEVPASASWMHAHTGLILPPVVSGNRRLSIRDTGTEELDVVANFESADGSLITTLYLFRSQVPSAPLWFHRSRTVLEQLRRPAAAVAPRPFALPGATAQSGLRIAYPLAAGEFRSTALAVAPVNGWIAKVRMTSKTLDPAALDAKLTELLAAIRWPEIKTAAPVASPVQPCPTPFPYNKARMLKPDMSQAVFGSLIAVAGSVKAPSASIVYCREPLQTVEHGVYRPDGSIDSYLIALADSGNALSVSASIDLEKKKPLAAVTMLELGHTRVLPRFNRLPAPQQVMAALPKMHPLASVEVGTTTVNMHGPGIKP